MINGISMRNRSKTVTSSLDVVEDLVVLDDVLSILPLQPDIGYGPHPGHLGQQVDGLEQLPQETADGAETARLEIAVDTSQVPVGSLRPDDLHPTWALRRATWRASPRG